MEASALAARMIAALMAALGTSTVVIAGHAYTADQLTPAVTLLLTGLAAVYGAVRTWRAKQITPRPAGAVVPHRELAILRRIARERDLIRRAEAGSSEERDLIRRAEAGSSDRLADELEGGA